MGSVFDRAVKAATMAGQIAPYIKAGVDIARAVTGAGNSLFTTRGISGPDGWGEASFLGGYTLEEMRSMVAAFREHRPANKNLFIVSVASPAIGADELGVDPELASVSGTFDIPTAFNMFCTDVGYGLVTITGETKNVGAARADVVQGGEPVEVRVTTMDDERGILKRWFRALAARAVHSDGTVGLPVEYQVPMTVAHAFAAPGARGFDEAYKDTFLVRPGTIEFDLSRSSREPQQVQMTFKQMDTHLPVRAVGP